MALHPDLSPVFNTNPNIGSIWKTYSSQKTQYGDIYLRHKHALYYTFYNLPTIRVKHEKTLKYLLECFKHSSAYVDFYQQGIIVGQGVIFDYIDYCFDVVVLNKNKFRIKLNGRVYHRNSSLKVYITSEFISKHKKVFDLIYPVIKKLNIEIVSRQQLKTIIDEEQ